MKKILGMVLVLSVFQLFATFSPIVNYVQTYAEEKTGTDINTLKVELEEEKESLVGLSDELEFIAEQEGEILERVDYLNTLIKDLEKDLRQGKGSADDLEDELDTLQGELSGEKRIQGELMDEKEAFIELKKETEDIISKLTTQIQKTEPITVVANTETLQQKPGTASESSPVVPEEPKSRKKELKKQLRSAEETLQSEIEELDYIEEEIEILRDEIQELIEEKEYIETSILGLLAKTKELETAIASIDETKENTKSSTEAKSSDTTSTKE